MMRPYRLRNLRWAPRAGRGLTRAAFPVQRSFASITTSPIKVRRLGSMVTEEQQLTSFYRIRLNWTR